MLYIYKSMTGKLVYLFGCSPDAIKKENEKFGLKSFSKWKKRKKITV